MEVEQTLEGVLFITDFQTTAADEVTFQASTDTRSAISENMLSYRLFDKDGNRLFQGEIPHHRLTKDTPAKCAVKNPLIEKSTRMFVGVASVGELLR